MQRGISEGKNLNLYYPPVISAIISKNIERGIYTIESKAKAVVAARASLDKKARDVLILELKGLTVIADYFVICSGDSAPQVKAVVEQVEEKLNKRGIKPLKIEGLRNARWVLMDYGDIIVHVFETETRDYYELEKFWLDALRISFDEENKDPVDREDKRAVFKRRN